MRLLLSIGLMLLLGSCCSTKGLDTQDSSFKKDSIFRKTELMVSPKILNQVEFHHICDTVTNTTKELVYRRVIEKDTVVVEVKDGTLSVRVAQMSQELSKKEYDYQLLEKEVSKLEKEVQERVSGKFFWMFICSVTLNILLLGYIFRRFLPFKIPFVG